MSGNPSTNWEIEGQYYIPFLFQHALISMPDYNAVNLLKIHNVHRLLPLVETNGSTMEAKLANLLFKLFSVSLSLNFPNI